MVFIYGIIEKGIKGRAMNKKELISKTVDILHDNDIRKHVAAQKTVFHISDDSGNKKDFIVKKEERGLLFTSGDVTAIIDACLAIIEDSLKRGEEISIHGFGTLGVHHRAARATIHPDTGKIVNIQARYVPKFKFGNRLRMAAKVYDMSLSDRAKGDA